MEIDNMYEHGSLARYERGRPDGSTRIATTPAPVLSPQTLQPMHAVATASAVLTAADPSSTSSAADPVDPTTAPTAVNTMSNDLLRELHKERQQRCQPQEPCATKSPWQGTQAPLPPSTEVQPPPPAAPLSLAAAARERALAALPRPRLAEQQSQQRLQQSQQHLCLICHALRADTYPTSRDGTPCFRGSADERHWYCQACLVDHMYRLGPTCIACDALFEQMETLDLGPTAVPSELLGARCVVCNSTVSVDGNPLILCSCEVCTNLPEMYTKAVHLGCTGACGEACQMAPRSAVRRRQAKLPLNRYQFAGSRLVMRRRRTLLFVLQKG